MKNITVSVDDEVYRRARVRAAQERRSLSALVRDYLIELAADEPAFTVMQREMNEAIADIRERHPGYAAAARLSREEVHDRHALR